MKKLTLAVCALLVATRAFAGGLMVIDDMHAGISDLDHKQAVAAVVANCRLHGIAFKIYQSTALRTLWIKNLSVPSPNGTGPAETFDAYVIVPYWGGGTGIDSLTQIGTDPNNPTTTRASWPVGPGLFVGPNSFLANKWIDGGVDTTGIQNDFTSFPANGYWMGAYGLDSQFEEWREPYPYWYASSTARRAAMYGIWRPLIGLARADSMFEPGQVLTTCRNCDFVARAASPDTVAAWMRYRWKDAVAPIDSGVSTKDPMIFCDLGTAAFNSGQAQHYSTQNLEFAMTLLDSVTGGKLYGSADKNRRVAQCGVLAEGALSQTNAAKQPLMSGGGMSPTPPDTLNQRDAKDRLNALGIPITFSVQADSAGNLGSQKRILDLYKAARFVPAEYMGTTWSGTNGYGRGSGTGSNATRYLPQDIFGVSRTRIIVAGVFPDSCGGTIRRGPGDVFKATTFADGTTPVGNAQTDTCFACLHRWARARIDSLWQGRTDTIEAPADEFLFAGISPGRFLGSTTIWNLTNMDSICYVLWRNGVRTLRVNLQSLDSTGTGEYANPTPFYQIITQPIRIWNNISPKGDGTDRVVGYIYPLLTRGGGLPATTDATDTSVHDEFDEFMEGWLGYGTWYPPGLQPISGVPGNMYKHDFFAGQTRLMVIGASMLGGQGDTAPPNRIGFWYIKWLSNFVSYTNRHAWNGQSLAIRYPGDLR